MYDKNSLFKVSMAFVSPVVLFIVFLLVCDARRNGIKEGEKRMRNEAVEAGAAYYIVDAKTGEAKFQWGTGLSLTYKEMNEITKFTQRVIMLHLADQMLEDVKKCGDNTLSTNETNVLY